ncbi:MAG TPA: S24 family peptidase [Dongiaceae bacterium]|jgi:phage repressor protein C with HTH and peptisase S24 domain|nr:S24 family peptidase [Dongiaceae bacterium]
MDTPISLAAVRLKELREQAGLSMRAVADRLGWSVTRYQHYEDRYKRRFLPYDLARSLAALFAEYDIAPSEILSLAGLEEGGWSPPPMTSGAGKRDLPILGSVKGGNEGFFFNEGEAKEFIERPANLRGVSNGFALYVDGDSMEPRFFVGEVAYVNPNRPLSKGCFVAVELVDGQGLIKQFLRRDDREIVLYQFNPPQEIRLPVAGVKQIYRITGQGETP